MQPEQAVAEANMILSSFTEMILERAVEPAMPGKSLKVRFVIQDEKAIQVFFFDRFINGLEKREQQDQEEKSEKDVFHEIHCGNSQ
jgi:hypothetical protein